VVKSEALPTTFAHRHHSFCRGFILWLSKGRVGYPSLLALDVERALHLCNIFTKE